MIPIGTIFLLTDSTGYMNFLRVVAIHSNAQKFRYKTYVEFEDATEPSSELSILIPLPKIEEKIELGSCQLIC